MPKRENGTSQQPFDDTKRVLRDELRPDHLVAVDDMTIYSHFMTMNGKGRRVRIAELKARLSEHLRYVRQGHTLTILDRNTPIADVVPHEPSSALRVREPERNLDKLGDVPLPPPLPLDVDVLDLLLEDRTTDR